jgi:hypothetical protein
MEGQGREVVVKRRQRSKDCARLVVGLGAGEAAGWLAGCVVCTRCSLCTMVYGGDGWKMGQLMLQGGNRKGETRGLDSVVGIFAGREALWPTHFLGFSKKVHPYSTEEGAVVLDC